MPYGGVGTSGKLSAEQKRDVLRRYRDGEPVKMIAMRALYSMTLPSGRGIAYPQARLVKGKFEDSVVDIAFKDNEHGKWTDVTEWYGTFVENAVSGTARDLLAAALMRLEAAGFPIVAHVHDEAMAEIHNGDDRREEFLTIMTIAPPWADGLPIAGDSVSQVAGYILARKLTRVTSRDIQSGIAAMSGLKRQDVEVICDQLESLGWLFRVQGPRRDSAHWDVNPEVHGKFAERAAREAEERAARRASIVEAAAEGRAHNIEDG